MSQTALRFDVHAAIWTASGMGLGHHVWPEACVLRTHSLNPACELRQASAVPDPRFFAGVELNYACMCELAVPHIAINMLHSAGTAIGHAMHTHFCCIGEKTIMNHVAALQHPSGSSAMLQSLELCTKAAHAASFCASTSAQCLHPRCNQGAPCTRIWLVMPASAQLVSHSCAHASPS